ncbi:hypothetical protein WN51_10525 [Melipona quadrifasciata]|uniref:Uncharacterized protein n=1 Tax=Melipona quadrifasciata TaxID=166423 RepID=A0A0M9A700_9HYME|nr:hypothetical protein WN51_10525 [Melipona quadrifasciata]
MAERLRVAFGINTTGHPADQDKRGQTSSKDPSVDSLTHQSAFPPEEPGNSSSRYLNLTSQQPAGYSNTISLVVDTDGRERLAPYIRQSRAGDLGKRKSEAESRGEESGVISSSDRANTTLAFSAGDTTEESRGACPDTACPLGGPAAPSD